MLISMFSMLRIYIYIYDHIYVNIIYVYVDQFIFTHEPNVNHKFRNRKPIVVSSSRSNAKALATGLLCTT